MAGKANKKTTAKATRKVSKKDWGRPAVFRTPAEMLEKVYAYFHKQKAEEKPPTIAGLALFLGFCDRQSLFDYQTRSEGFTCVIKRARTIIEEWHERMLAEGKANAGNIFWLKNHGWTDEIKSEVKTTVVIKSAKELKEGQDL